MLGKLPTDTVFEARTRNRRTTRWLLGLLMVVYVVFFNIVMLLFIASGVLLGLITQLVWGVQLIPWVADFGAFWLRFWDINFLLIPIAMCVGYWHFYLARRMTMDKLVQAFGARDADLCDDYHRRFRDVVLEAEAGTGVRGIRPVVLATTGCNAFALATGDGQCAIGVTEGLLAKLSRAQLGAVIAHEAAHLAHEDARLLTTVGVLSGLFDYFTNWSGRWDEDKQLRFGVVVWVIAALGHLFTSLLATAISRQREYLADAQAVHLCKDPLALAEALHIISTSYRGHREVPGVYAPVFIVNPQVWWLDDQTGWVSTLFCTHPPLRDRLEKLMAWARADVRELVKQTPETSPSLEHLPNQQEQLFLAHQEGNWQGPYTPLQLLTLGLVNPLTWVCLQGSQSVVRAGEVVVFQGLFEASLQKQVTQQSCPRCHVPLMEVMYEGTPILRCHFCRGHLLRAGQLERILVRREQKFSASEVNDALSWREWQSGNLSTSDSFPSIRCGFCQTIMSKAFQSMLTLVVIDRCTNPDCRAIWCDGDELERIQILVERYGR